MQKQDLTVATRLVISDGEWNADNWPDLKDSIKAHGQLVPVLCLMHPDKPRFYLLKDGRKRLAIVKALGLPTIDIRLLTPEEGEAVNGQMALLPAYVITLAGNIHADNPLSEARDIMVALDDGKDKQWFLDNFGFSSARVDRLLSLLALVDEAQLMVEKGELAMSAAYRICQLTPAEQYRVLDEAKNDKGKVTVAAVHKAVKKMRIEQAPIQAVPFPAFAVAVAGVDYKALAEQVRLVAMGNGATAAQADVLLQAVEILQVLA